MQTQDAFDTTNWTLIEALNTADHPKHERALGLLINRYWPPVYAAVRKSGHDRDAAADLTQAFFLDVILGRALFEQADASKGKMRTLLLTAMKRYLIDQHRRQTSRGTDRTIPLDDLDREEAFVAGETASTVDDVYERRWAMAVLEEAIERCEAYFLEAAKPSHWAVFERFVVQPALYGSEPPPLEQLAAAFDFASGVHVASALKVVRKRVRVVLREVAAQTASSLESQEDEYNRVIRLLG